MTTHTNLVDRACHHLDVATYIAERAETILGQALAGQIRLVRALAASPVQAAVGRHWSSAPLTLVGHLRAAAETASGLDRATLPIELSDWPAQLDDLATLAGQYLPEDSNDTGSQL